MTLDNNSWSENIIIDKTSFLNDRLPNDAGSILRINPDNIYPEHLKMLWIQIEGIIEKIDKKDVIKTCHIEVREASAEMLEKINFAMGKIDSNKMISWEITVASNDSEYWNSMAA